MKRISLALLIIWGIISSCSYSDEEKEQAGQLYNNILYSVSDITEADSLYAGCLQYLMREMQKPSLKRDKDARAEVEDSAKTLLIRYDSLLRVISESCAKIDTATMM